MDKQQMIDVLQRTAYQMIIRCGLIWIFLLALICILISKKPLKGRQKSAFVLVLGLLVWIPLFFGGWIASAFRDIKNEQIICCEGVYIRDQTYKARIELFINGEIYVRQGKNGFTLFLPANWTEEKFPEGEYHGTIFYSKESEVILDFIPSSQGQKTD